MRVSTAYFAGAGTVVVAIAVGMGGGLLMADIMNPRATGDVSKLEQHHARSQQAEQSPPPSQSNAAVDGAQTPATYLSATRGATTTPVVVSPVPTPQSRNDAKDASPPKPRPAAPAEAKTEKTQKIEKTASSDATSKPAEPSTPAARDQGSSPENAYAKAQDAEAKRSADEKRKADRAERRHKRAARRQQQRDQQQRDIEAQAREDTQRNIIVRRDDSWGNDFRHVDSDRPMRMDFPRFNLFDQD
jgi:hypothetical protein